MYKIDGGGRGSFDRSLGQNTWRSLEQTPRVTSRIVPNERLVTSKNSIFGCGLWLISNERCLDPPPSHQFCTCITCVPHGYNRSCGLPLGRTQCIYDGGGV